MSKFQELLIKTGAIFCAFLGGYSLYTVFSKGRYHSEYDEWMMFLESSTRKKIREGKWDRTIIEDFKQNKYTMPLHLDSKYNHENLQQFKIQVSNILESRYTQKI